MNQAALKYLVGSGAVPGAQVGFYPFAVEILSRDLNLSSYHFHMALAVAMEAFEHIAAPKVEQCLATNIVTRQNVSLSFFDAL
eukprot:22366-Eustigmatos_ZCMA.PRE.1